MDKVKNQVLHVFLLGGNGTLTMLTSSGTPHWILLILAAVHTYFAVTGKGLLFMALLWPSVTTRTVFPPILEPLPWKPYCSIAA